MRLALDTRTALIAHLPELQLECLRSFGRKHVHQRQRFLSELLGSSYERRRPHSLDRNADSFDRDYLVQGLRASPSGRVYTQLLEPFYDFPAGNYGYSKDRGSTKAYRLRPRAVSALKTVYRSDEPIPVVVYDDHGNEMGIEGLRRNGLPESIAHKLVVPSVLPLKLSQIDHASGRVAGWIDRFGETMFLDPTKPQSTTLGEAERILHTARKWVVSLGGLPNLYQEQSHGRLGPHGFHLIMMPSRLRHLLYEGSGMIDYDLSSCFWSIFQSLGRSLSFPTPTVDEYVLWKADWHSLWAAVTGHRNAADFKSVTTSWLTGGCLSASPRTASGQRLGVTAMQALSRDESARALYNEVQQGMKRVVREGLEAETCGDEKVYVNAVGKRLALLKRPADFGRLCSHALTGYEQFAVQAMCTEVDSLQAIIYDGFIAPPQPVEPLEQQVRRRSQETLGVALEVRLKAQSLSDPIPELERDPGDF